MSLPDNEPALTSEDRLKAVFYQFVKLYERWSEDRQLLAKLLAEVSDNVKTFEQQIHQFERIDPAFRKKLLELMRDESARMAQTVGEQVNATVQATTTTQVALVTEPLKASVASACQALENQKQSMTLMNVKFVLILLVGSLLSGLAGAYVMEASKSQPPTLTRGQQVTLQAGEFVQRLWPKLSKKEQQRLIALEKGKRITKKYRSEETVEVISGSSDTNDY